MRFTNSTKPRRTWLAISATLMLGGCGGPSEKDVAAAIGKQISNVSCAQAVGQPGYVCTFRYLSFDLTRRLVKQADGRWEVIFN
jgi:hypothetical protein